MRHIQKPCDRRARTQPAASSRTAVAIAAVVVTTFMAGPTAPLWAQVTMPAPPQTTVIALRGATLHTVTAGTIENGTIVFENGIITAIGADVSIPAGAEVVDVAGKHIYPGLVDAYSTVGIEEIGSVDVSNDASELGPFNPNARPNVAVNPESRHIGTSRTNGVLVTLTTPSGGLVSGLSSAMNMDGWTWEQMTLEAAAALNVNWPNAGGGGRGGGGRGGGGDGGYDGQLRTLRNYFAQARAYRDAKAAGDQIRSDSRFDAMIPALNREIPVIVNANDIRQIQDAIRWAEDEDIRLVIRGGEDAVYVAEHLAEAQIPVILTSTMDGPARAWQPYDEAYSRAARLHEAGVQIAISGGGGAAYTNRLPYEAGVAVAFGLPEEEAVKAVTINAARFVGIDDRVGSLETGKEATLLVTTGNPLDYLSNIEQAYIQGRNIDMVDIHRFFFDKYIQRVRLFLRIVS